MEFVERLKRQVPNRQETDIVVEGGAWILRENYGAILGPQKRSLKAFQGLFYA